MAVPVRVVDGARLVEPFAFAGEIRVEVPDGSAAAKPLPIVASDRELVIVVPRGVAAPTIRIDGGGPIECGTSPDTQLSQLKDSPGQRCTYGPSKGLTIGTRVLTVAFVAPDGLGIAASSVVFEAA